MSDTTNPLDPLRTPAPDQPFLSPVTEKARIGSLDVLRGLAILGILAVNALAFAWPMQVYGDPGAAPFDMTGANKIGVWVTEVFFHDKFRTLFSLLFGVSIFLVGGSPQDSARGALLRRRLFWLGGIALIHGIAIWYGDILLHYAYCGLLMMLMRGWSAKRLLWLGGGISAAWVLLAVGGALAMTALPAEFSAKMQAGATMDPAAILATIEKVQGGVIPAMTQNLINWSILQGASLFLIPVTVPLMMLGLGLFKSGFLTGRSPSWLYGLIAAGGALNLFALGYFEWQHLGAGEEAPLIGGWANAMAGAAVLITLGYVSVIILIMKHGLSILVAPFAPVGRMAFTNYLSQSLIMASVFYIFGGATMFGAVGPGALWTWVVGIWVLQMIWSPLWLSRFQMGPLEWVWRCLTYGRRVPLSRAKVAPAA